MELAACALEAEDGKDRSRGEGSRKGMDRDCSVASGRVVHRMGCRATTSRRMAFL